MAETVKELTPTSKFKRPSYETVVNWVKDSWNAVDVNLIKRSFKCCGIFNNRNGLRTTGFLIIIVLGKQIN